MTGPRQAADRPDLTYAPALYRIFFPKTRHIAPEKPYIPHRETRNKKIHKSKFIRIISKMIIPILCRHALLAERDGTGYYRRNGKLTEQAIRP